MIKIAFFDSKPYDIDSFKKENIKYDYTLKFFKGHLTEDTVILTKGYDTVCLFVNDYVDSKMIESLYQNGIRLIALRCAGYNNIDLKAALGKIQIVRVPAYSPYAVAEHAVALIMALNRKTHRAYYRTRDNNFTLTGLKGFDMYKKTAGIIGSGKIGRITAEILRGFGMKVLVHDPYPQKEWAESKGMEYVPLETLYRESNVISLHCPLVKENIHMINKDSLAMMKDSVILINTSRGQLIDSKSLIKALKKQTIGAAGLDVYEEETDYFFEDFSSQILLDDNLSRLLSFPNVLVTSHQAFFTEEALQNISNTTLSNIDLFFKKKETPNEVCYKCQ